MLRHAVAVSTFAFAFSAGAANKHEVLIKVDAQGCPTAAAPGEETCKTPADRRPDRMCRARTSSLFKPNQNKVRWLYEDRNVTTQFRIVFNGASPFSGQCAGTIVSSGNKPKTQKCVIDSRVVKGDEFEYSVVVDQNCPMDPKIYIDR